ncbi:serine/threonine protein kinase [Bdellovibrio sp. HCB-110]|uniref:serine/threonine protein kinase n=1 Tax=Bdellovibrio sp. HCB-110 TaxID=3391182 RepID=UPI0039B3B37B
MRNMRRIGNYDVMKLLATGGMAEVFLARSNMSLGQGRLVALKRTLPAYLDSSELCRMFVDEMKVAACLNHQNIVQTFDFGVVDSQAYFVMEYIHGVSLRELIAVLRDRGEYLPLPMVLYILKEVTDGLEYAANVQDPATGTPLNLIHRDLSPHNIMLTYDGEVKVIDFGIAKATAATNQTHHGIIKGKIAYMSPEQERGDFIDQRSDLFSLGIIFWELLCNRRFFAGSSVDEVKRYLREFRIDGLNLFESARVRAFEPILRKLLHHKVEKRYAHARHVGRDLQLMLNQLYPQFSSEELAVQLKSEYFPKRYLDSLEELRSLQEKAKIPERPQLIEKTIITNRLREPMVSSRPAMRTHFRVVSENSEFSLLDIFKSFLLGITVCCLGFIGYKLVESNTITAMIKPHRQSAAVMDEPISFAAVPSDASISINGWMLTSSRTDVMLKRGQEYQIEVSKVGYITKSFKFVPTKPARYEIRLDLLPRLKISENKPVRIGTRVRKTAKKKLK